MHTWVTSHWNFREGNIVPNTSKSTMIPAFDRMRAQYTVAQFDTYQIMLNKETNRIPDSCRDHVWRVSQEYCTVCLLTPDRIQIHFFIILLQWCILTFNLKCMACTQYSARVTNILDMSNDGVILTCHFKLILCIFYRGCWVFRPQKKGHCEGKINLVGLCLKHTILSFLAGLETCTLIASITILFISSTASPKFVAWNPDVLNDWSSLWWSMPLLKSYPLTSMGSTGSFPLWTRTASWATAGTPLAILF